MLIHGRAVGCLLPSRCRVLASASTIRVIAVQSRVRWSFRPVMLCGTLPDVCENDVDSRAPIRHRAGHIHRLTVRGKAVQA